MRLSIVSMVATALAGAGFLLGCAQGEMVGSSPEGAPQASQAGSTGGGGSGGSAHGSGSGVSRGSGGSGGSSPSTPAITQHVPDAAVPPPAPDASADATPPPTTPPPSTPPPPTTPPTTTSAAGTIVPLYTNPGDASWTAIATAKQAHPTVRVVAIVNPSNGPGSSKTQSYASGIADLTRAGIDVIGYVATGYGSRTQSAVEADIDHWKAFYPQLVGIFFDEQSNQAKYVPLYTAVSQYAKSQGLTYTVGNPGTDTSESYIGVFDTMLIYESNGVSSVNALAGWHTKYPKANFGVIPYGTPLDLAYVAKARMYVQYIYLNDDNLPNPWDSLPPYFSDLLTALE